MNVSLGFTKTHQIKNMVQSGIVETLTHTEVGQSEMSPSLTSIRLSPPLVLDYEPNSEGPKPQVVLT